MARELIGRAGVSAKPGGATRGRVSPTQVSALRVLAARTDRDGQCWLQVRLPTRPNVAKGWVAADRVQLTPTAWRIEVALRARMVTLLRGGERVARYRAVVGAPSTPTLRGLFALMAPIPTTRATSSGWVLTLTARSNALQRYDGRVALHGRGGESLRDPWAAQRATAAFA